ncbi:MAG TPA: hypothetical protein VK013_04085 [Myxococcaceae bacterium]|nr:hypothetical protein [Myxococcaceae bacterium]
MKSKIIGALVAAAALTTGCATEQAQPQCLVGHGDFIVKYYPKDAAAESCGFPSTRGEILSLDRYVATDTEPARLGVRLPAYLGDLGTQGIDFNFEPPADLDPRFEDAWFSGLERTTDLNSNPAVGVAQFDESDAPDADNFCRVSDFGFTATASAATAPSSDPSNYEEVPVDEDDPSAGTEWVLVADYVEEELQGAQTAEYAFKNVEFYVTTRSPGVTFRGDLTFTQTTGGASCTGEFTVVGLAPAFGGANTCATDADCDPCGYAPDGSYVGGTGIIPDLDVVCDQDLYGGFCFLRETTDGQPPELPSFVDDATLAAFTERCQANQRGEGEG